MNEIELHRRASELFLELRRLPIADREVELARAAGGDEHLRDEVAELLANDAPDDVVRERSAGEPPEQIGRYRVLGRLGSGGSGQVFLAEQSEPIRRRVAIKVVPQAAVDPELAARFEVERRALERIEHPNIARVLDAGRTADGLPYLVIDYVEGSALHRYCDEHATPLAARIELVLQIADAIEHAHQRGVIHRDLKPANILVAQVDGRATPRVLDFGIAKPVAGVFGDESPRTSGLPVGTPAYMAPEQTGAFPVDTRADVYALGAVTYELVAGRVPLETRGDPLAALQRIRDEVPPPASRVRASSSLASESIPSAMSADLDRVLAKTLEKQPERRYATVSAFAADLRRVLRCEPIEARAPTVRYRAARFVRRNRVLVAASALVLCALAVGIVGLVAGLLEAKRQQREAQNQSEAQREINSFLTDDLLAAASPDNRGPSATARELLDRASDVVDQRFGDRPLIAAAVHHTLGGAYVELGLLDEAEPHLERSAQLRREHAGVDAPDTIRSEIALASLHARRKPDANAERALRALSQRAREHLGADDPLVYAVLNDLGTVLLALDRAAEACVVLEDALSNRVRLLGAHDRQVLITTGNLANGRAALGDTRASLKMMLAALEIAEAMPEQRATLLALENNIGATYQDLGEDAQAAPHLRRAAQLAEQVLGPDHADTLTIQANLAGLESDLGDPERAAELYRGIVERRVESAGPNSEETFVARYGYWNAQWKAKHANESAAGFAELTTDLESALGNDHWLTAQARVSWAQALLDSGHAAEALPIAELGAQQLSAILGGDHTRTRGARTIAERIRVACGGTTEDATH